MSIRVTPEFRTRSLAFRAGVVVLVVLIAVLALTFKAQTGMPFAKTTEIQAYVSDVHSLRANDAVRQHSKRIGRVSAVEYKDGAALVTMELDGDVEIYRDAHAEIRDLSALATKFVELQPGTKAAGSLQGQPIPVAQTADSADLYELLDVLDPETRTAATSMLREVGGGLAGHGQDLGQFLAHAPDDLTDLGQISGTLADPQTDLVGLLDNVDALSSRLRDRTTEVDSLVKQTAQTFDAFAAEGGVPLRETIKRLPATLDHTDNAMTELREPLAETARAMRALEPGALALGRSEENLRGFLRDSVPVAHQVPGFAKQALPAVDSLTKTASDARPLAPMVRQAIGDLMAPLRVLAPYSPEIAQLFLRGASFVSQGPAPGVRYARLGVTPGANTLTGGLLASGNLPQNEYPAPGEAQYDRAQGLPPGLPLGAN